MRISQSHIIMSSFLSCPQQQHQKTSSRKMSCSKGSCQRTWIQSTKSQLKEFKKNRTRRRPSMRTNPKTFKTSPKRSMTFRQSSINSTQSWSRKNHLFSKRISFSGTLFFMRLQVTQMSWSGELCELLIQIRGPSPDWRFGVKCQFTSQDQPKLGQCHSSNRSCHRWSGMQRSQRMSFSSNITGWNSSQSMRRSVQKRSQTQSRSHSHFRMSRGTLLSPLNVSISDSTTWPQVHALLINYFNNAVPVDLKPIYQFGQSEKTEINSFKKGKGKGQKSK